MTTKIVVNIPVEGGQINVISEEVIVQEAIDNVKKAIKAFSGKVVLEKGQTITCEIL